MKQLRLNTTTTPTTTTTTTTTTRKNVIYIYIALFTMDKHYFSLLGYVINALQCTHYCYNLWRLLIRLIQKQWH